MAGNEWCPACGGTGMLDEVAARLLGVTMDPDGRTMVCTVCHGSGVDAYGVIEFPGAVSHEAWSQLEGFLRRRRVLGDVPLVMGRDGEVRQLVEPPAKGVPLGWILLAFLQAVLMAGAGFGLGWVAHGL